MTGITSFNGRFNGNTITLRAGTEGTPGPADDAKITVERGDLPDAEFFWDESEAKYRFTVPTSRLGQNSATYNILHTGSESADFPVAFRRVEQFPDAAAQQAATPGTALVINNQRNAYVLDDTRQIPAGGTALQVIRKSSATDYDFEWENDEIADARIPTLTGDSNQQNRVLGTNAAGNAYELVSGSIASRGEIQGWREENIGNSSLTINPTASYIGYMNIISSGVSLINRTLDLSSASSIGSNGDIIGIANSMTSTVQTSTVLTVLAYPIIERSTFNISTREGYRHNRGQHSTFIKLNGQWRKYFGPFDA